MRWLKAILVIVRYAPAVVEAIKKARERHPEEHKEEAPK